MVTDEAAKYDHVIAMGDYNFRQNSPYYGKITSVLVDSWLSLYPDAIGPVEVEKLDLSIQDRKTSSGRLIGNTMIDMKSRIDHIFISSDFEVIKAHYLPAPESATDHPLYYCVVKWK
jgi:endonuclease/exonuclease/phosphatase family metal-dependent hydrolase